MGEAGAKAPAVVGVDRDEWNAHWGEFDEANRRNPAQAYRRRLVLDTLAVAGAPARLLDIGSGNGELLRAAARRWPRAELLGLELSAAGVEAARRRVPQASFRVCDLLLEPASDELERAWATHAACSEVLEHVDEPVRLLRHARMWLAPGCLLVVTVPGGPMSAFDRHIGHRRHYSPEALGELLVAAGLEVVDLSGAGFPFFNLYRALVIARGERLVEDVRSDAAGTAPGRLAGAAMAAFGPMLSISGRRSRLGWQTLGVAREPAA
jgi:SAM-dependent methyltransferase